MKFLKYSTVLMIRIQFTFELEHDNYIPFLDMTVYRDETIREYVTNWYRKPVASGRMFNYHSIHPMSQRISAALGLIDRVNRLSDGRFKESNKSRIKRLSSPINKPTNESILPTK